MKIKYGVKKIVGIADNFSAFFSENISDLFEKDENLF